MKYELMIMDNYDLFDPVFTSPCNTLYPCTHILFVAHVDQFNIVIYTLCFC